MTREKVLMLLGSVCLALTLVVPMTVACAGPAPTPTPTPSPSPSPTATPTPSPPPTGELEVHWRWQCAFPAGDHEADVSVPWRIEWIEEQSGGKFTIDRFYGGEIIPPDEMLTGIGAGLAEIGEGAANYWSGIEPALDLSFGLPMSGRAPIGDVWAFQNGSRWSELLREIFAENNCRYIGWHDYGSYPVLCSRVPVRTIDDWNGVKVRISGYNAALLESMGASTCYIPGAEIAEALTMGTIDVGTWTSECIKDMGFGEVMDYLIMPPFMEHAGGVIFVNEEAWAELPDEYQELIYQAERMSHLDAYKFWNKYMADNINLATGAGTEGPYGYDVIYMSDEDVAEMSRLAEEVVWAEWAKLSPRCAEAVEILKEWYSTYRM